MSLRRELTRAATRRARGAAGRQLRTAIGSDPRAVRGRMTVAPDWRVPIDGRAPRLDPRTTIDVARPVGRWRHVDPRLPQDRWRAPYAWAGFGTWVGVVAALGGLGWWKGRGPLRAVSGLREFGSAIPGLGTGGFDDDALGVDDREAWFG